MVSLRTPLLLAIALLLTSVPALAQSPFTDCVMNVNNATVTFSMTAPISFPDDSAIEAGDEVALYTSDETCAGVASWVESGDNTVAAAGPSGSIAGRDGFASGEEIEVRIWDASTSVVYRASAITYADCSTIDLTLCRDDGLYETDAVYFPSSVSLVVLPVELTGFDARADGDRVRLSWTTASELNNAGFEVRRRATGASWTVLGFVDGHGTTSEPQQYGFTTDRLPPGRHAFRLRQVDVDGTDALSPIVEAVVVPERAALSPARPHPVTARGTLDLSVRERQPVRVTLYDLLGRRLRTLHDGPVDPSRPASITVNAATLASGTYLVVAEGRSFRLSRRVTVVR